VVVASRMIVGVVLVVVRTVVNRLFRTRNLEPENSSKDQYHAHDICKLPFSAAELACGRSHPPPGNQHIQFHPRRNPHERLDRSKNFAALLHNVASTKNFVFDSHWQQSRSIRWSYIAARKLAAMNRYPQNLCVVCGGVVKVLIVARIHRLLRKAIQLAKGLR
jgi:hypothetical protein